MLLSIIAGLSFIILQVTGEDIDRALEARTTSTAPNGVVYSFCEAEATPIAFALQRMGYALNVQEDEQVVVARAWGDPEVRYEMTGFAFWMSTLVCVDGERVPPHQAVLVHGEED